MVLRGPPMLKPASASEHFARIRTIAVVVPQGIRRPASHAGRAQGARRAIPMVSTTLASAYALAMRVSIVALD
jgi:hypothetical protein